MHRRWRGYLARRGQFLQVPPAPPVVAPSRPPEYIDARGWRPRWPAAALRRGRFLPVVPAPVVVAPPVLVPPYLRQPDARLGLLRRVRPYAAVPLALAGPAPQGIQSDSVRWRTLRGRRGAFYAVVPAPVVAGSAPVVPQFLQPDSVRWRTLRTRRGLVLSVPSAPVVVTAPPVVPLVERATLRRSALTRRGRLFTVPPAPVIAAAPALPPAYLQQETRRSAPRVRRGRYFEPSWPAYGIGMAVGVGGSDSRQIASAIPVRRGHFLAVPPVGTFAGPGPVLPVVRRPVLRRGFVPRRGEFFPPPTPVGVLPGTAPTPPRTIRQAGPLRVGWRLRRHLAEPPWPAVAPAVQPRVPGLLSPRRPSLPRVARRARIELPAGAAARVPGLLSPRRPLAARVVRRARFDVPPTTPLAAQPRVPGLLSPRRPQAQAVRRGRFAPVVRGGLSVGPGPLAPRMASTRRRFGFRARRGRFIEPVWAYVPPPPFSVGALSSSSQSTSTLTATGAATAVLTATTSSGGPS